MKTHGTLARTYDRGLHFAVFLVALCSSLVILKIMWHACFDKSQTDIGNQCFCSCFDKRLQVSDLEMTINYKGHRHNATDCDCHTFLLPRIADAFSKSINHTAILCDSCFCYDAERDTENRRCGIDPSFTTLIAAMFLTSILYLLVYLVQKCTIYDIRKAQRKSNEKRRILETMSLKADSEHLHCYLGVENSKTKYEAICSKTPVIE